MIITTTKQMRPRDPLDHYPTPLALCRDALALIPDERPVISILDPGAGTGPWGRVARERWTTATIEGVEVNAERPQAVGYSTWHHADFLSWQAPANSYDLVIGNPPYKFAEAFVRRSLELTQPDGYVLFLLRLAFLEGQARGATLWRQIPPQQVAVCSARPSFTGDGNTDATAYALFLWQRGWRGTTALSWLAGPAEQHALFEQEAA